MSHTTVGVCRAFLVVRIVFSDSEVMLVTLGRIVRRSCVTRLVRVSVLRDNHAYEILVVLIVV